MGSVQKHRKHSQSYFSDQTEYVPVHEYHAILKYTSFEQFY